MKRFYLSRTDNRIRTRLYWRKTIDGSVIGIFNEVIRQCYVFLDRDGVVCCAHCVIGGTNDSGRRRQRRVSKYYFCVYGIRAHPATAATTDERTEDLFKTPHNRVMYHVVVNKRASILWMKCVHRTEWKHACVRHFFAEAIFLSINVSITRVKWERERERRRKNKRRTKWTTWNFIILMN